MNQFLSPRFSFLRVLPFPGGALPAGLYIVHVTSFLFLFQYDPVHKTKSATGLTASVTDL